MCGSHCACDSIYGADGRQEASRPVGRSGEQPLGGGFGPRCTSECAPMQLVPQINPFEGNRKLFNLQQMKTERTQKRRKKKAKITSFSFLSESVLRFNLLRVARQFPLSVRFFSSSLFPRVFRSAIFSLSFRSLAVARNTSSARKKVQQY